MLGNGALRCLLAPWWVAGQQPSWVLIVFIALRANPKATSVHTVTHALLLL